VILPGLIDVLLVGFCGYLGQANARPGQRLRLPARSVNDRLEWLAAAARAWSRWGFGVERIAERKVELAAVASRSHVREPTSAGRMPGYSVHVEPIAGRDVGRFSRVQRGTLAILVALSPHRSWPSWFLRCGTRLVVTRTGQIPLNWPP